MKTLVLYANENGEEQQCVVEHPDSFSVVGHDLNGILPDYNDASALHLIEFGVNWDDRPDVTDGYGQEVPCHFITLG